MAIGTTALLAAMIATTGGDGGDFTPLPGPPAATISVPKFLPNSAAPQPAADATANHARAVRCLAAAISYEAGNEPIAGQEAVAQVVLNRARTPGYPKSVCGVVFQGAERRTGCQFTFTCDGSLRRVLAARSLAVAADIAERMLAGTQAALPQGATHYHADYVSPYWATTMTRLAKIGRHIFYRAPAGTLAPGATAAAVAEDDGRLPPALSAAPPDVAIAAPRLRAAPATSAGTVFAPWGIETLAISAAGTLRAVPLPDSARN